MSLKASKTSTFTDAHQVIVIKADRSSARRAARQRLVRRSDRPRSSGSTGQRSAADCSRSGPPKQLFAEDVARIIAEPGLSPLSARASVAAVGDRERRYRRNEEAPADAGTRPTAGHRLRAGEDSRAGGRSSTCRGSRSRVGHLRVRYAHSGMCSVKCHNLSTRRHTVPIPRVPPVGGNELDRARPQRKGCRRSGRNSSRSGLPLT